MEKLSINNGFVKLPRTILDWEWYDHPDVSRVYFHLLLKVNYAPAKWRGIDILAGEHITSSNKLSNELMISDFKVRNALLKLKETGYIEITTTNKFTKLKLINSGVNDENIGLNKKQNQSQNQSKSNTIVKQTTTNNNNKEKKEIEERKEFFKNEILKFSNSFSKVHLEGFYEYWSIENKQTGMLRFEEEFKWNLEMKITSWKDFSKKTEKKKLTTNRPL